jgi:hypothetical protein
MTPTQKRALLELCEQRIDDEADARAVLREALETDADAFASMHAEVMRTGGLAAPWRLVSLAYRTRAAPFMTAIQHARRRVVEKLMSSDVLQDGPAESAVDLYQRACNRDGWIMFLRETTSVGGEDAPSWLAELITPG